jgi:hypothetical protein
VAKPTESDVRALSDSELEALQLMVNGEVARRIQNERLENRLVTALAEAQAVGLTDSQVDSIFAKSRDRVKHPPEDPSRIKPGPETPRKVAKSFDDPKPSIAKIKAQHQQTTGDGNG